MEDLYRKLKEYENAGYYGFHMPGHKRNKALTGAGLPYGIDITEIDGFDDLHHAKGILKEAQERASRAYHADETHYLVNGSTVGILSAILGCTRKGDRILVARNCHRAVYHGIFLGELHPLYVYPERTGTRGINGEVSAAQIDELLRSEPDIRAVVITSPTYDGVVSDIRKIAECVHRYHIPLILDEAHGAHFGFHPYFPLNGNELGADVVIHSLHKTLPSLTQTALLHLNGALADRERIRMYLDMLQTSSPSYVLMASMDECVRILEERREEIFGRYTELLDGTRRTLKQLRHLSLLETGHYDRSKLLILAQDVISAENIRALSENVNGKNGKEDIVSGDTSGEESRRIEIKKYTGKLLYNELRTKYLLQMEMASPGYVLGMTSPADTPEGMERLKRALFEIDGKLAGLQKNEFFNSYNESEIGFYERNEVVHPVWKMKRFTNKEMDVELCDSLGCISAEYVYLYPPGIPLIVPGERISEGVVHQLRQYREQGFEIEGTRQRGKLRVIQNG